MGKPLSPENCKTLFCELQLQRDDILWIVDAENQVILSSLYCDKEINIHNVFIYSHLAKICVANKLLNQKR